MPHTDGSFGCWTKRENNTALYERKVFYNDNTDELDYDVQADGFTVRGRYGDYHCIGVESQVWR